MDVFFFFQAEDGIRDVAVTGVQTCALPIYAASRHHRPLSGSAARYLGNLCGPRGTSSTHPAHAASQRQTHSWSEARPASAAGPHALPGALRSEEHTSELQSRLHLVCRLLLEKKKRSFSTPQPRSIA